MSNWDTRIISSIQDAKAGAAAFDDARCTWADILDNSDLSLLPTRDVLDMKRVRDEYNRITVRADALLGLMSRLDDRLTLLRKEN